MTEINLLLQNKINGLLQQITRNIYLINDPFHPFTNESNYILNNKNLNINNILNNSDNNNTIVKSENIEFTNLEKKIIPFETITLLLKQQEEIFNSFPLQLEIIIESKNTLNTLQNDSNTLQNNLQSDLNNLQNNLQNDNVEENNKIDENIIIVKVIGYHPKNGKKLESKIEINPFLNMDIDKDLKVISINNEIK